MCVCVFVSNGGTSKFDERFVSDELLAAPGFVSLGCKTAALPCQMI